MNYPPQLATQPGHSQFPQRPPSSQQHNTMSFGIPMNTNGGIAMNGANMATNMNMNPAMNINQHNMGMNMNMNMNNINPSFLAAFQNPPNSQNGMMAKYSNYQGAQQSIPPSTPNLPSTQGHNQSISPSQLISASPSQLMGAPSQQQHSQGHIFTPAQLLQQQQQQQQQQQGPMSQSLGTMHPGMNMNMGGGAIQNVNMANNAMPNISGGAMNMGGGMQNMSGNQIQNMGMMSAMPNLSNPQMRVGMTPQRWAQMSPQERAMFQLQRQQLGLGQPPGAPSQQHHERGSSLTHDRPPSQLGRHDRASSQSHDRQPSQQPQDVSQLNDRPSSSASIRSHHNLDSGLMPPPSSRPGTSSGVMGAPNVNPRMNPQSMNVNPHLNMTPANVNPHMNQAPHINPAMSVNQAQQNMNVNIGMNMSLPPTNINPAMNQGQNLNPHLNRPPTRADSAHGLNASPRQSPRMSGMMNLAGGPGPMGGQVNIGMSSSSMGMHNTPMSGGISGGGNMNMVGGINPGMGTMASVPSINNIGPVNMNANTVGGLGAGGSLLGGAGGGLMGPPVIPQSLQRPDRDQIMQRDRSTSVHGREQSIPSASAAPFLTQGLDNSGVPGLGNIPGVMPQQQPQPLVNPHRQSPVRQIPPGHRSPMPVIRKAADLLPTPALPGTPNAAVPHPGAAAVSKLPPQLAALNPAVTNISYIPYTVVPKAKATTDGEGEGDEKALAEAATDSEDVAKIDDPVKPLTPEEITALKEIMKRDAAYEALHRTKQARMAQELRTLGPAGRNAWWERDYPSMAVNRRPERFDVRYPRPPNADRGVNVNRKKGVRREGIRIPRKLPPELANRPEQLVPIRLEFDVEHHKMREAFVWNLNDPVITPEHFAQTLVEDYALAQSYHGVITRAIQEQLSDYKAHITSVDGDWKPPSSTREMALPDGYKADEEDGNDADMRETDAEDTTKDSDLKLLEGDDDMVVVGQGSLDDEDVKWWESWRKRARRESAFSSSRSVASRNRRKRRKVASVKVEDSDAFETDKEWPRTTDEFEIDEKMVHEDLRILIKLDIIVGSMKLDDQFEWDLENVDASPEQFAEVYAKELGLGGEFKTAIAHSIREQVQIYQKSLFLVGHPSDGSLVQDDDLRMSFLPGLSSGARTMDQVPLFTPMLNYLSDGEIERSEKEREKELTKRKKRNTRGRRGITLPDREPNRTHRTPAIGFPELDAATLALAAASVPTSRRAAAAAASLTIANMVASENGTSVMPLQLPPQQSIPVAPVGKERKPKGLFKAPSYPSSVLRPRAQVSAPTPSTAVESTSMLPSTFLDNGAPVSSVSNPPPDSRAIAKKAKELEREAKEKEFVDGQHANVINGVWHCSNCGCPESVAIGRRKGPLGDKSQCGTCGKFWHRHRRPRPVTYNQDPEYHLGLRRETEQVKTGVKRKGRPPNSHLAADADRQKSDLSVDVSSRLPLPSEDDRAVSPVSTASSDMEAPLAQRITKLNGASHINSARGLESSPGSPHQAGNGNTRPSSPKESSNLGPVSNSCAAPSWLADAIRGLQEQYPDDKFEAILRRPNPRAIPVWRMKCLDCPGKLYNSGPGESLENYEVHLRNRQHRSRVTARLTQAPE